jgi:hypothetical protein
MSVDKRQFPRKLLEDDIYCYLDGNRFDAMSRDVSAGGLFLKTKRPVPMGTAVALVFNTEGEAGSAPVFLVGNVVRHQSEPVIGVGIKWKRAVTQGEAEHLKTFLDQKMGLQGAFVLQERWGARQTRCVYRFPVLNFCEMNKPVASEKKGTTAPPPPPKPKPAKLVESVDKTAHVLNRMDVQVVRTTGGVEKRDVAPLRDHVHKQSGKDTPGPLSVVVQRGEALAPTNLPAIIAYRGRRHKGTVEAIGIRGLYVTTPLKPRALSDLMTVAFKLTGKDGAEIPVHCKCRLLYDSSAAGEEHPGLELEIESYDEKGPKGIFWTYLKWLHFRSIRGQ